MKTASKVTIVALAAALAALCLAACGGGSASGSAAASSEAAKAYDPVYVVKHIDFYNTQEGAEPTKSATMDYELDEHGNILKVTTENTGPDGKPMTSETTYADYDSDGYNSSTVSADGTKITISYEKEDGHVVKSSNDQGVETEFTYYPDGKMKTYSSVGEDYSTTVEYDEYGRLVKNVTDGAIASGKRVTSTSETTWMRDADGKVTGYKTVSVFDGNETTMEYTVDVDENGNIVAVYQNGALYRTIEYQLIDNPSTATWVHSWNAM